MSSPDSPAATDAGLRTRYVGSLPLHDGQPARPAAATSVVRRRFGRHPLDRKDPFEPAGNLQRDFSFSSTIFLEGQAPDRVAEEIREEILRRVADDHVPGQVPLVVEFEDAGRPMEGARRYLVMEAHTSRSTIVSINVLVRGYGGHLYYSVRSYLLAPLSLVKVCGSASLLNVWLLASLFWSYHFWSLSAVLSVLVLAWNLAIPAFLLRKMLRALVAGSSFEMALRQQFPRIVDNGAFDADDVSTFLKTRVTLAMGSIATVLERYGIAPTPLREMVKHVHQTHIYTGGGSIIGSIIGGVANKLGVRITT
jgi:hypothetical protein